MDALAIAEQVNSGRLRAVDVVEEALARIGAGDENLRAFRDVWPDSALEAARALDASPEWRPLKGVPLGVKAWERLDSPQVRRLVAAGCVPVGATSVPTGTPWQTWGRADRGPTVNPWRADRTPGGSSAGSAAAVAAGLVPLATGIDGAGSVRIPAAWCGVVGVKVTNPDPGRLGAPGPLARSVADAAAYLGVRPVRLDRVSAIWSADLGFAEVDERVVRVARSAVDRLFATGVEEVERELVLVDPAEAWAALRARRWTAPHGQRPAPRGGLRGDGRAADPTAPRTAHGHDKPRGDERDLDLGVQRERASGRECAGGS